MHNYYESRLIKLISPLTNEVFTLEWAGDENELRELIATICNVASSSIKGIRDSFGNYYTISSAIKNPHWTTDYSTFYFVVLGTQPQQNIKLNTGNYNYWGKNMDMRPTQQYLNSVGNSNHHDISTMSMQFQSMNPVLKMNQISTQSHNGSNIQLNSLTQKQGRNSLSNEYSKAMSSHTQNSANDTEIYCQIINKLFESKFIDSEGKWKLNEMVAKDNEELRVLFKIYLNGQDLKKLASQISMIIPKQNPGIEEGNKIEYILGDNNKTHSFNTILDLFEDRFETKNDFNLIKYMMLCHNEQLVNAWAAYELDKDKEKLMNSMNQLLKKYSGGLGNQQCQQAAFPMNLAKEKGEKSSDNSDKKAEDTKWLDKIKKKLQKMLKANYIRFDILSLFNYDMEKNDTKWKHSLFYDIFKIPKDPNFTITQKELELLHNFYQNHMSATWLSSFSDKEIAIYNCWILSKDSYLHDLYENLVKTKDYKRFEEDLNTYITDKKDREGIYKEKDSKNSESDGQGNQEEEEDNEGNSKEEASEYDDTSSVSEESSNDNNKNKEDTKNNYYLDNTKDTKQKTPLNLNYNYKTDKNSNQVSEKNKQGMNIIHIMPAESTDNKGGYDEDDEEENDNWANKKEYSASMKYLQNPVWTKGNDNSIVNKKWKKFIKTINSMPFSEGEKNEIKNWWDNKNEKMLKLFERFQQNKTSLTRSGLISVIKGQKGANKSGTKNNVPPKIQTSKKEDDDGNTRNQNYPINNSQHATQKKKACEKPPIFKNYIKSLIAQDEIPRHSYGFLIKALKEENQMLCSFWEVYLDSKDEDELLENIQFFISKYTTQIDEKPESPSNSSSESESKQCNGTKEQSTINKLISFLQRSPPGEIKNKQNDIISLWFQEKYLTGNSIKYFSDKIDSEDMKITSAFEVFSVTGNHLDFVETLNIIQSCDGQEGDDKDEDKDNGKSGVNWLDLLKKLMKAAKFVDIDQEIIVEQYNKQNQMLLSILESYIEDDEEDTIDSLKALLVKVQSMNQKRSMY